MVYVTGNYPVTADGGTVGRVQIAQDGLKLVFDCACEYRSPDILRLAAVCNGAYVPLGVMVPDESGVPAGVLRMKKSFTKNTLLSVGYRDTSLFHLIKPSDVYTEPQEAEPPPAVAETAEAEPAAAVDEEAAVCDPEPAVLQTEQADVPPPEVSEPVVYNDFPNPEEYDFDYSDDIGGWTPIPTPGVLFNDLNIQEACEGISNALVTEQDGVILLAVPLIPNEPFPMMPVFCFGSSGKVGRQECIIFRIRDGNLTL